MGGGSPLAKIYIKVFEARSLPKKCSSYCSVQISGQRCCTLTVKNDLNPHWNQKFELELFSNPQLESILFAIFESKGPIFRDECLGTVTVPLANIKQDQQVQQWYTVKASKKPISCELHCLIHLQSVEDEEFSIIEKDWVMVEVPNPINHNQSNQRVINPFADLSPPHQISPLTFNNNPLILQNQNHYLTPLSDNQFSNGQLNHNLYNLPNLPSINPPQPTYLNFNPQENVQKPEIKNEEPELWEDESQFYLKRSSSNGMMDDFQLKCILCDQDSYDNLVELGCDHLICTNCLKIHVTSAISDSKVIEIFCPQKCSAPIPQYALKRVLNESEFDNFINRALQFAIDSCAEMFRCPKQGCGLVIEKINQNHSSKVANNQLGPGGKKLSLEAIMHRDEYRFRCRGCETEFCCGCMKVPYHLGFTCDQYQKYLTSRRCRFCKSSIQSSPLDSEEPASLADICEEEECQERKKYCCTKTNECGHFCYGIRDEENCLSCLHEDCAPIDTPNETDFCTICYTEELGAAPSIQLKCGHILHYHCVVNKLRTRWPSARITFGFWGCPSCKKQMEHPAIEDELAPLKELYKEISAKALQRLSFEGLQNHDDIIKEGKDYYKNPEGFAMNHFAYYPCFTCKKPYFGGQKRCDAGNNDRPFQPEDLVCGGCSGTGAEDCPTHGKEFMEHKCQFCCGVATWYCWGKTHFCDSCHTKQQNGDYVTKYPMDKHPKCAGKETCPLKVDHPPNGQPYCLGCMLCRKQDF